MDSDRLLLLINSGVLAYVANTYRHCAQSGGYTVDVRYGTSVVSALPVVSIPVGHGGNRMDLEQSYIFEKRLLNHKHHHHIRSYRFRQ